MKACGFFEKMMTDAVFHVSPIPLKDERACLFGRHCRVAEYGSRSPSSDRISLISCPTQTGVAAEHLFVH